MIHFLAFVKILVMVQLIIIAGFVFTMCMLKYIFGYLDIRNEKMKQTIKNILYTHYKEQQLIPKRTAKKLQKKIDKLLLILHHLQQEFEDDPYLPAFKQQLSILILKPAARRLWSSGQWLHRYYAVYCFDYGFDKEDEEKLFILIKDQVLLVSIHTALAAIKSANVLLINEMITAYAEGRHLQQTFFAQLAVLGSYDISHIVHNRLSYETDIYVRIFCYRILANTPCLESIVNVNDDLIYDSVDLTVSVVNYLAHCNHGSKDKLIYELALSPHWEVRAVVARALGKIHSEKSLMLLNELLKDTQWWVRVNSANALYQLGEKGIAILKAQSPLIDLYAFETAQKVLIVGQQS